GPYDKRFDVAVSTGTATRSLYSVIASRGELARDLAEAEQDRSEAGTRRSGSILGYPPCCVERFAATERGDIARREGINEAAIRATSGVGGVIPWEMNPLACCSPI